MALFTTKKIKDLDRPQAIAAIIIISFLLLLLLQDYLDLSLINTWGYNTIVDTYFCNNIKYFYNFKLCMSTAMARDSKVEIHKYSNINLAIEVGK